MGNIHTVGPNQILVISGGCCGTNTVKTISGGYAWRWWFITKVQRLKLQVLTLQPRCYRVETAEGVPLTVTGVAQVKFMKDEELLKLALEQFLDKKRCEIEEALLQTLEGHLRAILGSLTVEEVYKDRDQFANQVRKVASPDVGKMGIEILSFTIKDVNDDVAYLDSLGKTQIAVVKRDADIGVAEAEKDAGILEAEYQKMRKHAEYQADILVADSSKTYFKQQAAFDSEVNVIKAQSELAYQLQEAKENQAIQEENINITIVERRKQIELEDEEIKCNEKKLDAEVKQPAEAEAFKMEQIAHADRLKKICQAQAEAEAIKLRGAAEAEVIQLRGLAEAHRMQLRADAYKKYGDVAQLNLILDTLPKIATQVAAPLGKIDEIVRLSGSPGQGGCDLSKLGQDFTSLVANVPPGVRAMTGIDLSKVIEKIPGASATASA